MSGARRLGALVAAVGAGLSPSARAQEPTGFLNRAVTVDGVRHRYQVYLPAEYSPARRWPVILFLQEQRFNRCPVARGLHSLPTGPHTR